MKLLILIFCVVALVFAAKVPTLDEFKPQFRNAHDQCQKKVGVDKNFVLQSLDGKNTEFFKKTSYYLCIANTMGGINSEGQIDFDHVELVLNNIIKDPEVRKALISKCLIQKPTGEETALHMVPCGIKFILKHGVISPAESA